MPDAIGLIEAVLATAIAAIGYFVHLILQLVRRTADNYDYQQNRVIEKTIEIAERVAKIEADIEAIKEQLRRD